MNFSVIFDMDGVIVDSNPYHKIAWKLFCEQHGINATDEDLEIKVFGRIGDEGVSNLLNYIPDKETIGAYVNEIDRNFRDVYAPFIKPIAGLENLLELLNKNNIKCAVATSAPSLNVDMILDKTGLRKYFVTVVDKNSVTKGKPDPEIYLKAASLLSVSPDECIVIEDSVSGVTAALNAGMKVIGITTTHKAEELKNTNYVINSFSELDVDKLQMIFLR